jgi:heptosyltransferase II
VKPASARTVVVRLPNWLGDIVMALPALAMVRRGFPAAKLSVALPSAFAPLFREATDAEPDEIIAVADAERGLRREAARLRQTKADVLILFTNSFGSAAVGRLSGIRERWGYRHTFRGPLLTRAVARPKGRVHHADYFRALAGSLGMPVVSSHPRITPSARTIARGQELLQQGGIPTGMPVIGVAPGASYGLAKQWPPARVAEVARRLLDRGVASVLVGAASDREAARAIESSVRTVDLIGRTNLTELIGVVAACGAFLSNDSGAMHLAAALGRPVVATFGPTDERVTAPEGDHDLFTADVFCRPCMLRDCPIDHRCMKRISPDRVADALLRRIQQGEGL